MTARSLSALEAAGSIDAARVLAWLLVAATVVVGLALYLAPWQQNVSGSGRVTAYAALDRQQIIEAPVDGRVTHWHAHEGDHVEAGDRIVDLSDNDPEILDRLERERRAIQAQVDAAGIAIAVAEAKISALESVRVAAVSGAGLKRQMAEDRREGAQRALDASRVARGTAELNLERQRKLEARGLASTRALELAELEMETTKADVDRATAALAAAKREVKAMAADRDRAQADTGAEIEEGRAALQRARAEQARAEGHLAQLEVRLSRQQTMSVVAPRRGTVLRLVAKQGGEMVKQGDQLAVLVPDTDDRAVELWIDGNDAPLVTPGRQVRLQFEGWPAVQFVGWPSVAVGTFGGEVAFVDSTDNGRGQFRVVVVPTVGEPWPNARYLRQGVRCNGWVLLDQVSLGYELWRQFNGFPPAIQTPKDVGSAGTTASE